MTKKDIVKQISTAIGLPQTVVGQVMQRTFDSIIDALATEGKIELRDFAVIEVVIRKGRNARNPRTGEPVAVPDRRKVKFTPGREIARKVLELGRPQGETPVTQDAAMTTSAATKGDADA